MKITTKKILAVAIVFLFFCRTNAFAQGDAYQQGSSIISVGYGFPNIYADVFSAESSLGGYTSSGFGPIHLKYEYAINEHWGIGLNVSYLTYKNSWSESYTSFSPTTFNDTTYTYTSGYKGTALSFLARVNYHFLTSDKFDPYVGIGLGYTASSFTYTSNEGTATGFTSGGGLSFPAFAGEISVGCRYYFVPSFAVWAEVGYGVDIVQVGLNVKFGGQQ